MTSRALTMADHWDARLTSMSRRRFLTAAGAVGAAAAVGPTLLRSSRALAATAPSAPHLAYGADAQTQMVVSWKTEGVDTTGQRLVVRHAGTADVILEAAGDDIEVRDVAHAHAVYSHVALDGLTPGASYDYDLLSDAAVVTGGTLTTAPAGAQNFIFTALGDQGVDSDTTGSYKPTAVVSSVVAQNPDLHFHVGDLCYAYRFGVEPDQEAVRSNVVAQTAALDRIAIDHAAWDHWLDMISDPTHTGTGNGARNIPWMAAIGNHEMEPSYGPTGYRGVTSRLHFPGNGVDAGTGSRLDDVTYFFDHGNVRFIALDANDANFEIPGNIGYLAAVQDAWLEDVLADANRPERAIDFIVVGYHQCSYCTNLLHASDAGMRTRWDEKFRRHGVDLVINGHNHSYERAHPFASDADHPASTSLDLVRDSVIDSKVVGPTFITAGAGGNERVEQSGYELGMASYVTIEGGVRVPETAWWSAARRLGPSSYIRGNVRADVDGDSYLIIDAISPGETDGAGRPVPFDSITLRRKVGARGR